MEITGTLKIHRLLFLLILMLPPLITAQVLSEKKSLSPESLDYFKKTEPQLFYYWGILNADYQKVLENQLQELDLEVLKNQRELIFNLSDISSSSFDSFDQFATSGNRECESIGQHLIKNGQVGCLLLAGGQGTRLRHSGPKGTYPISVIKQKSLFQLCAEKVRAASKWANRPLRLAIMTSPENDEETRFFFQKNDFFGLQPSQISFFVQNSLPFLDPQGKLFLKSPFEISMGPDGNGTSLLALAKSGILDQWVQEGIKYLNVILVDNPLAIPFDAELVGFHLLQEADITLKCTEKFQPEEKVGVLISQNGVTTVVEYSEMSTAEKNERRENGKLKHCCANLSLFCFSIDFIERMAHENKTIPLHKAWKAASYLNDASITEQSAQPIAWKFETFIFDWLVHTEKVAALLYPREQCFAPLKNSKDSDSPRTVQQSIQEREREILRNLGLTPPEFPFELSAEFYYPTPEFLLKWMNTPIRSDYLD